MISLTIACALMLHAAPPRGLALSTVSVPHAHLLPVLAADAGTAGDGGALAAAPRVRFSETVAASITFLACDVVTAAIFVGALLLVDPIGPGFLIVAILLSALVVVPNLGLSPLLAALAAELASGQQGQAKFTSALGAAYAGEAIVAVAGLIAVLSAAAISHVDLLGHNTDSPGFVTSIEVVGVVFALLRYVAVPCGISWMLNRPDAAAVAQRSELGLGPEALSPRRFPGAVVFTF